MTLLEMFENHKGLFTEKYPHHLEIYERYFSAFRGKDVGVLEIGIRDGGSLQLWREYFGEAAWIYGLDIQDRQHIEEEVRAEVFVGDQGDVQELRRILKSMRPLDIVIDDGSHVSLDQKQSFAELFPALREGGIYVIEDIHTSYRAGYNDDTQLSFVEYLKEMIDSLHKNEQPGTIFFNEWEQVFAIHIYPSLAIIEKRNPRTWGGPTIRGTHAI